MYGEFTSLELDRPDEWILRITLRTPGKLNAVGREAHGQLASVWRTVDRDPGHGSSSYAARTASSARAATSTSSRRSRATRRHGCASSTRRAELVYAMIECRKPIVSAIEGACVGAGLASPSSRTSASPRPPQADRRAHPARRRRRRPRRHRLAAALRSREGEVPPPPLRAGRRRDGRADRPRLALRPGRRARAAFPRRRAPPRRRLARRRSRTRSSRSTTGSAPQVRHSTRHSPSSSST